jgi:hypothetical protein
MLRTLNATRYVTPLKEGGSLPAVVDTDEDGLWVVKFRGAGQGAKALIAEVIVGELARAADLPVPDIAVVDIDASFGRTERDPEIQDLLNLSRGENVGLRYLDGAFNYHERPARDLDIVPDELRSRLVWLDAFTMNMDRTHRNPNLLIWERAPWLIDHGAALYFHHAWGRFTPEKARAPFAMIGDHIFLRDAGDLDGADEWMSAALSNGGLGVAIDAVPDSLLEDPVAGEDGVSAEEMRARYRDALRTRLEDRDRWLEAAREAHRAAAAEAPTRLESRR